MKEILSHVVTIISTAPDQRNVLYLPKPAMKSLQLRHGVYRIACGGITTQAVIFESIANRDPNAGLHVFCSPDVIQRLRLVEKMKITLYRVGELIRFGPVIGIMAKVRTVESGITGQQEPVFKRLLEAAREENVFAYVFSPDDVDHDADNIFAYTMFGRGESSSWVRRRVPVPDVIYDQIVSRKYETNPKVQKVKEFFLTKMRSCYFNPNFFDKWQIHQWLLSEEDSKVFLPPTLLYESRKSAVRFLEEHENIFIKPIHGSLGVGIVKIQRLENGGFYYQVKGKQGIDVQGKAKSAVQTIEALKKRLRNGQHILQKSLQLLRYDERPFDIRVLLQKNGRGQWVRTKSMCRIAREGDITSNLSTGGDAHSTMTVLREIVKDKEQRKRIRVRIDQLNSIIPKVVERHSGWTLGELGLDIGIDQYGRPWVIEVNSKPWKKPETESGSMKLVLQSFRYPISYAKFLSGTGPSSNN